VSTKLLSELTPDIATAETEKLIRDSDLKPQVSRVLSHLASHLPDIVATVVLVRFGGDIDNIANVLRSLPGSDVIPHTASISIFRKKRL
jgi:hypothetical protein